MMKKLSIILTTLYLLLFAGALVHAKPIKVGAERLEQYLPMLKDKRVGMMVNQSSLVGKQHLVDVLLRHDVNIVFVLAVEHGFRGDAGAGETIDSSVDSKTGVPIISLYGKQKKLNAEQASRIDVLIYDLQDVGVRFYTYSRSLHFLLQACHENNKQLLVLDRPNPNGDYIAGPILKPAFKSGLSIDPLPLVHGLTMAELALLIKGQAYLEGEGNCNLSTVPVANYDHNMAYSLPVRPSPNLPNDLSIRLYPSLALFEGTPVSVGRGTDLPFQVLGYPDKTMGDFKFVTKPISGSWSKLNHEGVQLYGEHFIEPFRFSLEPLLRWRTKFKSLDTPLINRPSFFDKLMGDDGLRKALDEGTDLDALQKSWQIELNHYQAIRKKYLLYPDSHWIKQSFPQHGTGTP